MEFLRDKDKKILGFGEIMLRLTPLNYHKVVQADMCEITYGGAEANVIYSLSLLGHNTKFVTKLPDNGMGQRVIRNLRGCNIDVSDILVGDGRIGICFVEPGHGLRSSEVMYDRKYSAISMADKNEFDIDKIIENVGLLHISGITPALSSELYKLTINLIKRCNDKGILISLDSNYRGKLWSVGAAKVFLEEALPYADIAFLGDRDIKDILGIPLKEDEDFEVNLENLYKSLLEKYPNIKYAACTKRKVNFINNNTLKGYFYDGHVLYKSREYTFDILDRVGGGDAFTAGILHGLLNEMEKEKIVEFGICASALKHSIIGDMNIVNEKDIISLMENGLQNIKR